MSEVGREGGRGGSWRGWREVGGAEGKDERITGRRNKRRERKRGGGGEREGREERGREARRRNKEGVRGGGRRTKYIKKNYLFGVGSFPLVK